ncbi:hypothetical protein CSTERTH_06675 [Thermoclostridium stercorarium subsp. thermolacticum DSM 2910]|uniref:Phage capsid protein n=2 Tax=Thermoclostridium stercorarium TaxID=1510 RepID=A0A1B1YD93_THEST|nr:hypothetical protein CSTERTH_06675 [Thermoclostridium stercorarium subsp. thermolacticum DSM 2910]
MIKTTNISGEILDLTKELTLIDAVNLPFTSLLLKNGRQKTGSVIVNWKYENLDSSRNLSFEGADVTTFQTSDRSTGDKNVCQIITKAVSVSETAQAVTLESISDLFAHELNNRILEAKRDLEYYLINGEYNEVETVDNPRQMKGLVNFIPAQYIIEKSSNPKKDDLDNMSKMMRQAGTASQNLVLLCDYNTYDVVAGLYEDKTSYIGVTNEFGSPVKRLNLKYGACDVYLVDSMPVDTMVLCNMQYLKLAELRPLVYQDLAKTGSSRKGFIEMENTLKYLHPAAATMFKKTA